MRGDLNDLSSGCFCNGTFLFTVSSLGCIIFTFPFPFFIIHFNHAVVIPVINIILVSGLLLDINEARIRATVLEAISRNEITRGKFLNVLSAETAINTIVYETR